MKTTILISKEHRAELEKRRAAVVNHVALIARTEADLKRLQEKHAALNAELPSMEASVDFF